MLLLLEYQKEKIIKITKGKGYSEIILKTNLIFNKSEIGSSLCCNGTCLTITKIDKNLISFYLSKETLDKTNFQFIALFYTSIVLFIKRGNKISRASLSF